MPHKAAAAALVDHRSPLADRLAAVNCVAFEAGGSLGDNTDGPGLVAALRRGDRFDPEGRRCLVIGGGGAARAVVAALADSGAEEVVVVNRSPDRASSAAALAGSAGRVGVPADAAACDLVVNATPVGMAKGGTGEAGWPVDPTLLSRGQVVVDLVYHPPMTPWLEAARARGAVVSNGLGMLVHQAALQWALWTGLDPPVEIMWRAVQGVAPGG
jgi:shikimate dehydrogenase